jgi:hypothetical protein
MELKGKLDQASDTLRLAYNATNQTAIQANASSTSHTLTLPALTGADTLVSRTSTDTLSNKTLGTSNSATLKDSLFTLQNASTAGKQVQFSLSGLSAVTRTWAFPDASDTFVGLAATQSVSNKTLGNTNAITLKGLSFTLQDDTDATKQAQFGLASITTGTTRTFSFPDATGKVVLEANAATLTNKTLSGASNTFSNIGYSALVLTGAILNADLAGSIAYSKLVLTGNIVNADISASAAIAYSKLALTGAIQNADLAGSIAYSKLALTGAIQNSDLAGSIAYSKLSLTGAILNADLAGSIAYSKLVLTGSVVNADISASAAIAYSKLALTGSILNADINASAAIAGTKISPNFGSQNISTTGTSSVASESITGTGGAGYLELAEQSAAPSNPASSKIRLYSKTTDEGLYFLNSSGTETQVGSGSGEKNYLATGASSMASWSLSGGGVSTSTATSGSELPRPNTTKTGLKISRLSGSTDYAYYRFTLDNADYNKKLKFQFDMRPGSSMVASDFKIDVYSNTASNYAGTSTRLALSTDSSSVSALPLLTGTYRTTFDAPGSSAPYIEVRVGLNASTASTAIVLSDIVVGPGVVQQGAAVSEWVAYTPTGSWVSNTTYTGKYRRVGDTMEVEARAVCSGAPTASDFTLSIPSGFTIDTSKLTTTVGEFSPVLGSAAVLDSATRIYPSSTIYASTTTVSVSHLSSGNAGIVNATNPITFGASDDVTVKFTVPIAEWAGSGTVNVVQNDVEYVSNSNVTAATATDTTNYVTGPSGSLLLTGTPSGDSVTRQVQWATPIQAGDSIVVEVSANGSTWCVGAANVLTAGYVEGLRFDGTNYIGIGLDAPGGAGSTTSTVRIGKYRAGTSSTWDGTGRWRVVRFRGGQAVGFGEVQPGVSSGLVSASGLKGTATNDNAPAGYVGEYKESKVTAGTSVGTTGQYFDATSLTLTAGDWDVSGFAYFTRNGATFASTDIELGISGTTGNSATGLVSGVTLNPLVATIPTSFTGTGVATPVVRVQSDGTNLYINGSTISSTQVVYLKGYCASYSAATPQYTCILRARRPR